MSEEKQLIVIDKKNVMTVFTEEGGIKPLLKEVEQKALALAPDTSTAKGRKEIASLAYRVSTTKTYIDDVGKKLVDGLKELPKKVDANRKEAREFLDALRDKVRAPLDEIEKEEARIEAERIAKVLAIQQAQKLANDHEFGLLMNAEFDRKRAEQIAAAERVRVEAEQREAAERERLIRQALESAQLEAAERAETERKAAQQAVVDAEARARKAEQDAAAAAKEAERRVVEAAENAKRQAEAKANAEKRREAAELEQARRDMLALAKNKEHQRGINKAVLEDLGKHAGLTEAAAKKVVAALAKGMIRHTTINY